MHLAHAALSEKVVLKERQGTQFLAAGFGDCSASDARFLRFVLQVRFGGVNQTVSFASEERSSDGVLSMIGLI
jgi:hypothetical protein